MIGSRLIHTLLVSMGLLSYATESLPATQATSKKLIDFKVIGQDEILVSILVRKGATDAQLSDLVIGFYCANTRNNLTQLGFPPTTPSDSDGPNRDIEVLIFDSPNVADGNKLREWNELILGGPFNARSELKVRKFVDNIRASYKGTNHVQPQGSIGYDDHVGYKNVHYKPISFPLRAMCPK